MDILGVREDGLHELSTLFYPLPEPSDLITIRPGPAGSGLMINCSVPGLDDESNTMAKAWRAFSEVTGSAPDLTIELDKRIPMGAGLGGGSSDAAVLLEYLNRHAGDAALSRAELTRLAASVGADTPFFLFGAPAWAGGAGDILEPADVDLSGLFSVLACPGATVSTAWAYRAWDENLIKQPRHFLTQRFSDIKKIIFSRVWLRNDFERVVFRDYPEIRIIKERLLELGASGAVMSGSGASVFALFSDRGWAGKAAGDLAGRGIAVYENEL